MQVNLTRKNSSNFIPTGQILFKSFIYNDLHVLQVSKFGICNTQICFFLDFNEFEGYVLDKKFTSS